jgi:hypothetical protein
MQIFIPLANLAKIFACLDWRRLGKQRVECKQILDIILNRKDISKKGWRNHPAVKMYAPYTEFLKLYFNMCVEEWVRRGYKNNMPKEDLSVPEDKGKCQFYNSFFTFVFPHCLNVVVYPNWWGDEEVHSYHRANLIRKDAEYYSQFKWTEAPKYVQQEC